VRLKQSYSAREVAALTGLTARQLQWWDERRLFASAVRPRRTASGGFTERRYTPVDLLELLVLADLRRQGFSVARIRLLLETLRRRFKVRLFETIGGAGPVTLLTDGREIYARLASGEFVNLLRAPDQPMLVIGEEGDLKELSSRVHARRRRKGRGRKKEKPEKAPDRPAAGALS
jgi:DNA-binding transcriptional MerR regulator